MKRLIEGISICGHRGSGIHGIENTVPAMRHAMEIGVDMIETDVRMTSDGHLMLMHNRNISDVSNGQGTIEGHTRKELANVNVACNAKRNLGLEIPEFVPIATLEELLELACEFPHVILNVEMKDIPNRGGLPEEFCIRAADKAADMIIDYGLGSRALINSFAGSLVERQFRRHADKLHYHTFYPWNNNGDMTIPPIEFCQVVCPLNWMERPDGTRYIKQEEMPDSILEELSRYEDMNIIVSGGAGDDECQILDQMIRKGGSILMTDNPDRVVRYYRNR